MAYPIYKSKVAIYIMAEGNISTSDLSSYVLDRIFEFFAARTYLVIVAESNSMKQNYILSTTLLH